MRLEQDRHQELCKEFKSSRSDKYLNLDTRAVWSSTRVLQIPPFGWVCVSNTMLTVSFYTFTPKLCAHLACTFTQIHT